MEPGGGQGRQRAGASEEKKSLSRLSVALVDVPSAGGDLAGQLRCPGHHQLRRALRTPAAVGEHCGLVPGGDLSPWHHFALHRGPPRSSSSDPDWVVVDGVPAHAPGPYDEAVSGGFSALAPDAWPCGPGLPLPGGRPEPPSIPRPRDTDTGPGSQRPAKAVLRLFGAAPESIHLPHAKGAPAPSPKTLTQLPARRGSVASTSPGIDIADGKHQPRGPSHPGASHPHPGSQLRSQIRPSSLS